MTTRPEISAYIGLGANLGDAAQSLRAALQALDQVPGIRLKRASRFYRSAPLEASGPDFINAVAEVQTRLNAMALLRALQAIENAAGRQRPYRNAPRTLDLDLLLYGSAQISCPSLSVPHPRMAERAFVLLPLAQIAPERVGRQALAAVLGQGIEACAAQG